MISCVDFTYIHCLPIAYVTQRNLTNHNRGPGRHVWDLADLVDF